MGGSDCELLGGGWIAQPANALSSLAYLLAATVVLVARRRDVLRSPMLLSGVVALALVSLGSFAYHGPQPWWADALHDGSITALLVVYLFLGARSPAGAAGAVFAITVAVAVAAAAPSTVPAVHASLAVAVVALEWWRWNGGAPAPTGVLVALSIGIALLALGRTGAPLCAPGTLAQAHAGWHLFSAAAAGLAFIAPRDPAPAGARSSATAELVP